MKKELDLEIKQYELFSIGAIKAEASCTCIHIIEDYRSALKYLDLFSHASVFFISNHNVSFITVKILKVNVKSGVVEIEGLSLYDSYECNLNGVLIFDIKPYFPCEDRVKESTQPAFMKVWPKWLEDISSSDDYAPDIRHINPEREVKEIYNTPKIGCIRKKEGQYFLELNEQCIELINGLKGFSHIKILWWFDKFDKKNYRKITECNPPYENAPRTGIFASRSPVRPNPIAMTAAKIESIDLMNKRIKISPIDAFDNTPIINIIPYIPVYDRVREYKVPEWLKHWPEWVDDRNDGVEYKEIEAFQSDIERINKFMVANEKKEAVSENMLEEYSQDIDNHPNDIVLKGVRQNNLKNINCVIQKNKITVITGVSGSGKSSLAFDTIYAESQRRFMDCMSNSRGAFLEQFDKPDLDYITGLPPAVAIEQKTLGKNPRSTVGTMTDIYDYLRLLFAKAGTRHCSECGRAVVTLKSDEIVDILVKLEENTFFIIQAFSKDEILGEFIVPSEQIDIRNFTKQVKECVKKALSIGNGAIKVNINNAEEFMFQTKEICYYCNKIFFELNASNFSFNNPESMCPVCKGLGVKLEVDEKLIIAKPELSILDGASEWWGNLRKFRQKPNANWMRGEILALAKAMNIDLEVPWNKLPEDFKKQALYGSDGRTVSFLYENANGRKGEIVRPVEGAFNAITRLFRENTGDTASRIASTFMREKECSGCHGERLAAEGRLVSIAGIRFPETVVMTIENLKAWVNELPKKISEKDLKISLQLLRQINKKLQNLIDVGVAYLTLDRSIPTLSGGEAQRVRLANQLGSGINNILYVLDEPSIGLHPKDHKKLIEILNKLRDEGNTVVVVEHDEDTMLAADKIIDIGPGAGIWGGQIVAEGTPEEIMQNSCSGTGKYLKRIKNKEQIANINRKKPHGWINIIKASHNNLKNVDAAFPLGVLTCVTGVSGSGKSSLVSKTLYPALERFLNESEDVSGRFERIEGLEGIDKIINVTQQPIGRTPKSNPATYTGVFDEIRNVFASLEESKSKGYEKNKFSFNSKEGQCEACLGEGRKCVEMHFMSDVWIECSICHGKRFNAEALEIKYNGKTIADILDMNVEEALELFENNKKVNNILKTLKEVGLGYIKLGQNALTLSGGEAQRVKLAKELSKGDTGRTIYLLDEPTTGLHFSDVENLIDILKRITEAGNTVIVIEHNLDIIKNADWIIDLGPEGGNAGGNIVAQGTPEEVAGIEESYTGNIIKSFL